MEGGRCPFHVGRRQVNFAEGYIYRLDRLASTDQTRRRPG